MTQDTTVNPTPPVASPDELTERERVVLEAIAERPSATQQELADVLGVSRATISKRANGIAGFDWQDRVAYVEQFFGESVSVSADGRGRPADGRVNGDAAASAGGTPIGGGSNGGGAASSDGGLNDDETAADTSNQLVRGGSGSATVPDAAATAASQGGGPDLGAMADRLDDVEDRLASLESNSDAGGSLPDPALVHKVIHACMEADTVSREEELRVIAAVVPSEEEA